MGDGTIGIAVSAPDAAEAVSQIRHAEELGVAAVWLTSGGGGGDSLTVLSAAAAQTERVLLGTSIVQTWSRHPVAVAQQVRAISGLAPGRFRLGVGPGHKQAMESTFGAQFRAPLGHLTEYLRILKGLLQEGEVDFDGRYYAAHTSMSQADDVPVMASALRPKSFELCGAEADGAISWVCPHQYLRDSALPAVRAGAARAGRPAPPLIVHAPIIVHEDAGAVRDAVRSQLGNYPRTVFYAQMFSAAGLPVSAEGGWTDAMIDAVAIYGDEAAVSSQLKGMFGWGAAEILGSVVTVGDSQKSADRTMRLLAQVSAS
jgi:F420-dependent oxidoreductase-like protein